MSSTASLLTQMTSSCVTTWGDKEQPWDYPTLFLVALCESSGISFSSPKSFIIAYTLFLLVSNPPTRASVEINYTGNLHLEQVSPADMHRATLLTLSFLFLHVFTEELLLALVSFSHSGLRHGLKHSWAQSPYCLINVNTIVGDCTWVVPCMHACMHGLCPNKELGLNLLCGYPIQTKSHMATDCWRINCKQVRLDHTATYYIGVHHTTADSW